MNRSLAAGEDVRMRFVEREQPAAILEHEPGAADGESRTEADRRKIALDERHHGRRRERRSRLRDHSYLANAPTPTPVERANNAAGSGLASMRSPTALGPVPEYPDLLGPLSTMNYYEHGLYNQILGSRRDAESVTSPEVT